MAKAFYNSLTNSLDAEAAGTHVLEPGQTLSERKAVSKSKNFFVLDVMSEINIDISGYTRQPLTEELARRYDVVVSMVNKNDTPNWLLASEHYVHWDVSDPRGQDFETTAKVRDDIRSRVAGLIKK